MSAPGAENPNAATDRQRHALINWGCDPNFANAPALTKAEASTLLDQYKASSEGKAARPTPGQRSLDQPAPVSPPMPAAPQGETAITPAPAAVAAPAVAPHPQLTLADIPDPVLLTRYGVTRPEIEAIKAAIAPVGTTDYEMLLYLGVTKRLGLDPFVPGLVHFARFKKWGKDPKDPQGRNIVVGERTGIILGYLGYMQLAQQQQDFDGIEVHCEPNDAEVPLRATATLWKKGWGHPLTLTVLMKEKRGRSPFWNDSPKEALEVAAIRRVVRMGWPSLFAAAEDADVDDADPLTPIDKAVSGRVGTVRGEHHDVAIKAPVIDGEISRPRDPPGAEDPDEHSDQMGRGGA